MAYGAANTVGGAIPSIRARAAFGETSLQHVSKRCREGCKHSFVVVPLHGFTQLFYFDSVDVRSYCSAGNTGHRGRAFPGNPISSTALPFLLVVWRSRLVHGAPKFETNLRYMSVKTSSEGGMMTLKNHK